MALHMSKDAARGYKTLQQNSRDEAREEERAHHIKHPEREWKTAYRIRKDAARGKETPHHNIKDAAKNTKWHTTSVRILHKKQKQHIISSRKLQRIQDSKQHWKGSDVCEEIVRRMKHACVRASESSIRASDSTFQKKKRNTVHLCVRVDASQHELRVRACVR